MPHTLGNSVLIIDDDEQTLEMIRALVEKNFSCHVFAANNGITGLELARNVNPRLVILDLSMPYFTGFDVLDTLRMNKDDVDAPNIIICSVITDAKTVEQVYKYGINGFVKKPFMPEYFLSLLAKYYDKREQRMVLAVDAEEAALNKIEQIFLTNSPHELITVESGIDAMEILREREVSLVIAAADMPIINGARLLSFMREDYRLKKIPFLLTVDGNLDEYEYEDILEEAEEYQYQGIIKKPFVQSEVIEAVNKLLR